MSKIYEALRRHDQKPWIEGDEALRPPQDLDQSSFAPNRQMQALYRSIEALVPATERGAMIMFSSAHAGEGKTTVCGTFASTLAQSFGKSVLILDGDSHHSLTRHWGSGTDARVATLEKSPELVMRTGRRTGARGSVSVIPVGSLGGSDTVDSPDLSILLASIKPKITSVFDYILIDVPSLTDAIWSPAVGAIADGVILVVEAERTRWPVALNSKKEFEGSGARILGVFLNKRRLYIPARIYRRM